eukprot:930509-Prymnesium_polylepis.1
MRAPPPVRSSSSTAPCRTDRRRWPRTAVRGRRAASHGVEAGPGCAPPADRPSRTVAGRAACA